MPREAGTWPAFWMLSNDYLTGTEWPLCGEIDIMEHPNVQNYITSAVQAEAYNYMLGNDPISSYTVSDYDTNFHVYGFEWTSRQLSFYVDGNIFLTVDKSNLGSTEDDWPFDQPFWLILNLAIGGSYGGDPSSGTYPCAMQVDWVHVYRDQAAN